MKKLGFRSSKLLSGIQPLLKLCTNDHYIDLWALDRRSNYWWSISLAIIISMACQTRNLYLLHSKWNWYHWEVIFWTDQNFFSNNKSVLRQDKNVLCSNQEWEKFPPSGQKCLLLQSGVGETSFVMTNMSFAQIRSGRNFLRHDKNVFCSN